MRKIAVLILLVPAAYAVLVITCYVRGVADTSIYDQDTREWHTSSVAVTVDDLGQTWVTTDEIRGLLLESERLKLMEALRGETACNLCGKMIGTQFDSGVLVKRVKQNEWKFVVSVEIFDSTTPQSQSVYLTRQNATKLVKRLQQGPAVNRQLDRAAWFGAPAVCGIIGVLASRRGRRKLIAAHDLALAAEEQVVSCANAKRGELTKELSKARSDLDAKDETIREQRGAHISALAEIRSTLDRQWKARLAAENILKSAFITLYDDRAAQRPGGAGATQAHDLSQSLERALADLLVHDRDRLALIELKKETSEFHTEIRTKFVRRGAQMRKIAGDPEMVDTSRACHFGGWGVRESLADMEFAPYFDAWNSCLEGINPVGSITVLDFLTGFVPDYEAAARFGVRGTRFIRYVQLLESCAPSGTNSDTSALLLVYRSDGAATERFHIPNLRILVEVLLKIEVAEKKRIAAIEAEKLKQRPPETDRSFGFGGP